MFGVVHTVSLLCPKTDDSDQEISEFAGYTPFIHDFIMNEGKNGIEHWYKTLVWNIGIKHWYKNIGINLYIWWFYHVIL